MTRLANPGQSENLRLTDRISITSPRKPERKMHKIACAQCPSEHYPADPESEDIAKWPHAERVQTAFACAWNGKRFCKGYCDQMGISDADLQVAVFE